MNKKALFVFAFLGIFASAGIALAHQPRLVGESGADKIVEIKNPAVSQAFYGELKGAPAVFKINLPKPETIYFNILSPSIKNSRADFSVKIVSKAGGNYFLDGPAFEWAHFHEEYAGDDYLKGPEATFDLLAGETTVTVFSPDNTGKYVLAVGQDESFPFTEIVKAVFSVPQLKIGFFERSVFSIFSGKIGMYLLVFIAILAVLIFAFKTILEKK